MPEIMKKSIIFSFITLLAATACTDRFLEYNSNPQQASEEQMGYEDYISKGTLVTMQTWISANEDHRFQFQEVLSAGTLNGYFAITNGKFTTNFAIYNPTDDWSRDPFVNILPEVYGAHLQLRNSTSDPIPLAVANIIEVAVFAKIADTYGPIPYSKMGKDGSLTAPYDALDKLYYEFVDTLDSSINTLTELQTSRLNATADVAFGGDLVKWVKYANTLKLRLGVRMAYCDPTKAKQVAEEAANHSIGTLASVADMPMYYQPVRNRYHKLLLEWGDYRVAADIICYMNGYNDPRRSKYFQLKGESGEDCDLNGQITCDGYVGWRRGVNPDDNAFGTGLTNIKVGGNDPISWICAAEAAFLKAEGALRGWNMGGKDAREWYETGVRLSFEQWGVSGADAYLADASSHPESYVDVTGKGYDATFNCNISPAWDESADFEANLERIITQKWIANWRIEGVESWTEFRRTGYPRLLPPAVNLSGGCIPEGGFARRQYYPIDEANSNKENYQQALIMLGGPDNMGTRLWWDCNPNNPTK